MPNKIYNSEYLSISDNNATFNEIVVSSIESNSIVTSGNLTTTNKWLPSLLSLPSDGLLVTYQLELSLLNPLFSFPNSQPFCFLTINVYEPPPSKFHASTHP